MAYYPPPTPRRRGLSPRWFVGIVGGVLVVIGFVALVMPVNVDRTGRDPLRCGTAMGGMSSDPRMTDAANDLAEHMYGTSNDGDSMHDQCRDAIGTRQAWSWPLAGIGAATVLGALVVTVAQPRQQRYRGPSAHYR